MLELKAQSGSSVLQLYITLGIWISVALKESNRLNVRKNDRLMRLHPQLEEFGKQEWILKNFQDRVYPKIFSMLYLKNPFEACWIVFGQGYEVYLKNSSSKCPKLKNLCNILLGENLFEYDLIFLVHTQIMEGIDRS